VVVSRAPNHRLTNYTSKIYSIVHCPKCYATGKSSAKWVKDVPDGYFVDEIPPNEIPPKEP